MGEGLFLPYITSARPGQECRAGGAAGLSLDLIQILVLLSTLESVWRNVILHVPGFYPQAPDFWTVPRDVGRTP